VDYLFAHGALLIAAGVGALIGALLAWVVAQRQAKRRIDAATEAARARAESQAQRTAQKLRESNDELKAQVESLNDRMQRRDQLMKELHDGEVARLQGELKQARDALERAHRGSTAESASQRAFAPTQLSDTTISLDPPKRR
jgi:sensor c-di-GMP phosphodiesterase-like protein